MHILMTGNTAFKLANFRDGLIRALRQDGHQITALVPLDDRAEKLRDLGCALVPLEMDRKGLSPLGEARLYRRIYRTFRNLRPDMIFGFTIKNNIWGGLAAARLDIPFIPNITGLGTAFERPGGILNRSVIALYKQAFRRVPMVLFQNDHDRDLFLSAGIVDADRMRVLPGSGVNLAHFDQRPLPGAPDAPVFLLIARMLRDKGIAEFVAASRLLTSDFPKAKFRLLGPVDAGSRVGFSAEDLAKWQTDSPARYLGERRDVRDEIAHADCVVLPSYYREGTPRALLEAAAMGRPLVTTDMPGCRDTVIDGETGFLCTPRDVHDLAEKMRRIAAMSPDMRSRIGAAGRAFMRTDFDEEIVVSAYQDILSRFSRLSEHRQTSACD